MADQEIDRQGSVEKRDLLAQMHDELNEARKFSLDRRKEVEHNRKLQRGKIKTQKNANAVNVNLIYTTALGLLPHLFAQNPEASARASSSTDIKAQPWVSEFGSTLEALINQNFSEGGLKKTGLRWVMSSLITGAPWIKATYQNDVRQDPIIQQRLNDVQDNIQNLETEEARQDDPEFMAEREARAELLADQKRALEDQVEIPVSSGMRYEFVPFQNIEVCPSVAQLVDYERAPWMAQQVFIRADKARQMFGAEFASATTYALDKREDPEASTYGVNHSRTDGFQGKIMPSRSGELLAVWERWNLDNNSVYTFVEGDRKQWAREPYTPEVTGHRFYPFFLLDLYPTDGGFYPMDLVELIKELQDEYNSTRSQLADHRELSIPHWIMDSKIDRNSVKRFRDAQTGNITLIDTQGKPLTAVVQSAPTPTLNPQVYDVQTVRSDIDTASGLPEAQRGGVVRNKTATEAEHIQQGLVGRTSFMQDRLEDTLSDIARYTAQILLGELTHAEVLRAVGPSALWPQLSKEDAFEMVTIDIRSGSSGKPDKQRAQRVWMETLEPLLLLVDKIRQIEMQGMDATAEREIVRETFQRLDERIDVDKFLPPPPVPPQAAQQLGGLAGLLPGADQVQQGAPQDGNVLPFPGQPQGENAGALAPPQPIAPGVV